MLGGSVRAQGDGEGWSLGKGHSATLEQEDRGPG